MNDRHEPFAGVEPEDLLKFGLIPEFIGRLPVIATLEDLDEDALKTPDVSIALGARVLGSLRKTFPGHPAPAIAASPQAAFGLWCFRPSRQPSRRAAPPRSPLWLRPAFREPQLLHEPGRLPPARYRI